MGSGRTGLWAGPMGSNWAALAIPFAFGPGQWATPGGPVVAEPIVAGPKNLGLTGPGQVPLPASKQP